MNKKEVEKKASCLYSEQVLILNLKKKAWNIRGLAFIKELKKIKFREVVFWDNLPENWFFAIGGNGFVGLRKNRGVKHE